MPDFSRISAVPRALLLALSATGAFAMGGCSSDDINQPRAPGAPDMPISLASAPTSGLVGEWKLNESGGAVAADTKNGYNATVFGGAAFVPGKLGNALDLNNGAAGTGGKYAEMPSNATLDNVQEADYTISAWFFPYSVPTDATVDNRNWAIVAKNGQHMGLFYEQSRQFSARHYITGDVQIDANSAGTFAPNAWYHVAGVVSKSAGTVKVYVNGALQGTATFAPNTAAREYDTNRFRIGRARINWAADGKVDQVRIYNRVLSATEIANLANETQGSSIRFAVGMFKGPQLDLLGMQYTPDGQMIASAGGLLRLLDSARAAGARVTVRVTGGNANFQTNGDRQFVLSKWKAAFDAVKDIDVSGYVADGTFIGHYAIDEPYSDFDNLHGSNLGPTMEQMCQYQKSFAGWRNVPCVIRELNTRLRAFMPAGGYQYVDAGWSQLTDHQYDVEYNFDMGAYYRTNLAKGREAGLGMMYGFNLVNGGREFDGCTILDGSTHNCVMTAAEIRAMSDTIAAIESSSTDHGCGLLGYEIDAADGPVRSYFFSSGIQSAMQYMNGKVAGLQSHSCSIR